VVLAEPGQSTAVPLVSVVVCTAGRRRAGLRACLDSLRALDDPNYELVVVDNGATASVAADEVLTVGCRVVHEPRRGLDRARNRGIAEALGDVVAFVDDDCEVDEGWLEYIRVALADPEVAAVTGRVRPASTDRPSERWFEAWFSFDRGPAPHVFDAERRGVLVFPGAVGTGCNMAYRREVLQAVGGFDEAIEMGTLVGGGGDIDMFARVLDAGHQMAYMPDALVVHHHRSTVSQLRWQFWGYGVSFGALCCKFVLRRPAVRRDVARLVWRRLRYQHLRRMRARVRGADDIPVSLMLVDAAGVLVGPFAYAVAVAVARLGRSR
jgi:glycosyltransferase involved in cell wall biosynthesis